jgi:TIR domain
VKFPCLAAFGCLKVFLSYASPDRSIADSIALSLRGRGNHVFLDRDDLPAGQSYDEQIERAVKKSRIFVFLISPDSVAEGRYALTELKYARQKWNVPDGHVLPVMVRKTPLPDVPPYLRAVTILEPGGDKVAEVSAAVEEMKKKGRAGWAPRYIASFAILCAIAAAYAYWVTGHPKMVDCKEEAHLRSIEGSTATSIAFVNETDQPIQIYWLGYDGKRTPFGTLAKDQVLAEDTFMTHPWVVTRANGRCKAIYLPSRRRSEVGVAD